MDSYERIGTDGAARVLALDEEYGGVILDRVAAGESHSSCFVFYDGEAVESTDLDTSEVEHTYTSTGRKFWRHPAQMNSYREGTGRSVISTHISPEGACNLKCPYCSVTYRDTHKRIRLEVIQDYVRKLKSRGLKAVILTGGGEPTAYPHVNALVQWLKHDQGLSVALITNGTLSRKLDRETWQCFSWVRVSINIFDGWQRRIDLPVHELAEDCVVGCSMVVTVEHEATEAPRDRVQLLQEVAKVARRMGAKYVRLLPNCLLKQEDLVPQHRALDLLLEEVDDDIFFHQHKVHGAPTSAVCHQSYFRPYLSEEVFGESGEPGAVYPCDSLVLNESHQHFHERFQLCAPGDVLKFLDRELSPRFSPYMHCSGCVFTRSVEMLGEWRAHGGGRFDEIGALEHEEFV